MIEARMSSKPKRNDPMRLAFERSPLAQLILTYDDPSDPQTLRLFAANEATGSLAGFTLRDCEGSLWEHCLAKWRSSSVLPIVHQVCSDGVARQYVSDRDDALFGSTSIHGDVLLISPNTVLLTCQRMSDSVREPGAVSHELERLTHMAHHDLQEPLRTVASYLSLFSDTYGEQLDDRGQRWIRHAADATTRMRELLRAMLQWTRLGAPQLPRQPLESKPIVDQIVAELAPRIAQRQAEVVIGNLPDVVADPAQLQSALHNLITNALKFNRGRPRVEVDGSIQDGHAVFEVRDNGIGIEPTQGDPFDMLRRLETRDEFPGSGVGLAIVRKVAQAHGGRAWFEPRPEGGTAFFLALPLRSGGGLD